MTVLFHHNSAKDADLESSCVAWKVAELLAAAMLLLLGCEPVQIVMQAVELVLPNHAIVLNPVGNVLKAGRMDTAGAPLGSAAAR